MTQFLLRLLRGAYVPPIACLAITASLPGTALATSFATPQSIVDIGSFQDPALVDIDNDGDLDLFVGAQNDDSNGGSGALRFFENTGTPNSPLWTGRTGTDSPLEVLSAQVRTHNVAFADIDNDGDLDAFVSINGESNPLYFRNEGNASSPSFTQLTGADNPLASATPAGSFPALEFVDLDNDNDLDAFLLSANNIQYFENTGDAANPSYVERIGADNPLDGFPAETAPRASFVDFDGDQDFDLFLSTNSAITYYENTGTRASPAFVNGTGEDNPFNGFSTFSFPWTAFGDVNGDGNKDVVIGNSGDVQLALNLTPAIVTLVPADNATDVLMDSTLQITFSENVDVGTGDITLHDGADDSVLETIAVTDSPVTGSGTTTISIDPAANLPAGTTVYVNYPAGAFLASGDNTIVVPGITDPTTWNFSTLGSPAVSALVPPDDATAIPPDRDLQIQFSQPVAAGSGNITLHHAADNALIESIPVDGAAVTGTGGSTVTINPAADLPGGAQVYVNYPDGAFVAAADTRVTAPGITDPSSWNFTIASAPPTVTTTAVSNVTMATAQSGGNVTADGGAEVTIRGVCWSTRPNPTTADTCSSDGAGLGAYSSILAGLTPGTLYRLRAYATNSQATAYGSELSFTTQSEPPPPADDNDGVAGGEEDGVPTPGGGAGDGNGDGIHDRDQSHVASLLSIGGKAYLTLALTSGTALSLQKAMALSPESAGAPATLNFPFGLVSFEIHGVAPNQHVTLNLLVPRSPQITGYFKRNPQTGSWDNIATQVDHDTVPGKTLLTIQLTEGGGFDLDSDGTTITDPGGPGFGAADTAIPVPSLSPAGLIALTLMLLLLAAAALRRQSW